MRRDFRRRVDASPRPRVPTCKLTSVAARRTPRVEPSLVGDEVAARGSLIAAIEDLRRSSGRTLKPYVEENLSAVEAFHADNETLDPEGLAEMFETLSNQGLFRLVTRFDGSSISAYTKLQSRQMPLSYGCANSTYQDIDRMHALRPTLACHSAGFLPDIRRMRPRADVIGRIRLAQDLGRAEQRLVEAPGDRDCDDEPRHECRAGEAALADALPRGACHLRRRAIGRR